MDGAATSTLWVVLFTSRSTGRPPFPGERSKDKILRHRSEEPAPIPQFNAAVPPAFVGLVRHMMAKDPEQRLPSAAAARHELLHWADKGPGLPLDRPEDLGYEEAVALLEAKEPSAEQIVAEVLPAGEESSPTEPLAADEASQDGASPGEDGPREESPSRLESIPEVIPVGIPEPVRPRARRISQIVLADSPRQRPGTSPVPAWLVYGAPAVLGMILGLIVLFVLWLLPAQMIQH